MNILLVDGRQMKMPLRSKFSLFYGNKHWLILIFVFDLILQIQIKRDKQLRKLRLN